MAVRSVARVVAGQLTSDGAGVKLRRTIGTRALDHVDPFLLLDEFRSDSADDYLAGFPDHPHRGFETVTYMRAGAMEHRDHAGNRGLLGPGSVQWMTAGRGIVHSEMPRQQDGLMWGFQLWVNLPSGEKMREPRYQEFPGDRLPEAEGPAGTRVRVVAGEALGTRGLVQGIATSPLYLDVRLPGGASFTQPVEPGHTVVSYVYEGEAVYGAGEGRRVPAGSLAVLEGGDEVHVRAPQEARV
ncbi:MAG TPA: pirin family protein, partial [Vicinamibacteria bacterium]|nr:pirin family protein [Vicinamibacteria bacterium]